MEVKSKERLGDERNSNRRSLRGGFPHLVNTSAPKFTFILKTLGDLDFSQELLPALKFIKRSASEIREMC
jgi:hypothetical protein